MKVEKVIWWQHNSKSGQHSSATVHKTLQDYIDQNRNGKLSFDKASLEAALNGKLKDLKAEVMPGF
jgi:CRISPR-associated protein Csd2